MPIMPPPTAIMLPWQDFTVLLHLDSLKFHFPGNVQSLVLLVVVNLGGNTHQLVDGQDRPTPKLGSSSKTIHPLPLLWHFNSVDLEMALYIMGGRGGQW